MKSKYRPRKLARQNAKNQPFFGPKEGESFHPQTGFFQPKLEIDPVDSPAEKEEDAVATQVANHPQQEGNQQSLGPQRKKLNRQATEEELATKRIQKMDEEEPAAKRAKRRDTRK